MNRIYFLLLFIYIPFQVSAQSDQPNSDIALVSKTFTDFKTSVQKENKDWPEKFVDSNSVLYYAQLLTLIKEADSTQLMEQSHSNILTVLYLRYQAKNGDFSSIKNPYDLIYYLGHPLFQKQLEGIVVRDIKISGATAIVYTSITEKTEYIPYDFILQDNKWKLYLLKDTENMENAFLSREFQALYGSDKSTVIKNIIHVNGWDSTNKNIWLPQP